MNKLASVLALTITSACVTHQADDFRISTLPGQSSDRPRSHATSPSQDLDTSPDNLQLSHILGRLLSPAGKLLSSDRQVVNKISSPVPAGSLEEATIAAILIHRSQEASAFAQETLDEQELDGDGAPQTSVDYGAQTDTNQISLEALASEWGVRIDHALKNNPYLSGHTIMSLALKAVESPTQSLPFREAVREALRIQSSKWIALHERLGPALTLPQTEGSSSEDAVGNPGDAIAPSLPYRPNQLNDQDSLLIEAQDLIGKHDYIAAIDLLQKLEHSHVLFETAQEKIKEASNLAVQDLRKRAAKSFQSAIPVSDHKAKLSYLLEAKQYLEEAITKYPAADQIATVRQNLSVINKNLSMVEDPAPPSEQ